MCKRLIEWTISAVEEHTAHKRDLEPCDRSIESAPSHLDLHAQRHVVDKLRWDHINEWVAAQCACA